MTLCVRTGGHCLCQPDEGVFCPDYRPDPYVQCLMDTITALLEPTHEMLKALAGDPLILAVSHEEDLRRRYAEMLERREPQLHDDGN
jgi:hypothetical protein